MKHPYSLMTAHGSRAGANQDWLAAHVPPSIHMLGDSGALFAVADGMGGRQGGEVASRLAIRVMMQRYYAHQPMTTPADRLAAAFGTANGWLCYWAKQRADLRDMGTTLTAIAVAGGVLHVAHIGDSRAYLVREGRAWRLTRDETWVAGAMRRGLLTPREAAYHPWRNILVRYLGQQLTLDVSVHSYAYQPGDYLVLTTDGVTDWMRGHEVARLVAGSPKTAPRRLIQLARKRGSQDDASMILVALSQIEGRARFAVSPAQASMRGAGSRPPSYEGLALGGGVMIGVLGLCLMLASL
jgi:PPM family protein phosphatase